jgi:PIN domain nuclease of toxin-antitoxin system
MEIHKTTIERSEKLLHALSITQILKDDYTEIPGLFHKSPIGTLTIGDALNYNFLLISNTY